MFQFLITTIYTMLIFVRFFLRTRFFFYIIIQTNKK